MLFSLVRCDQDHVNTPHEHSPTQLLVNRLLKLVVVDDGSDLAVAVAGPVWSDQLH